MTAHYEVYCKDCHTTILETPDLYKAQDRTESHAQVTNIRGQMHRVETTERS